MPTLDFKGKSFVYTHHLSVPFRELVVDVKKSEVPKGAKPSLDDNLIIHGDNLHALKALLPVYVGKVDCIYIDPPYNTGNEGWCYNDNVRSPLMKEWLKKAANPVEKDDLERHEKWLCMMWPRLKLLHELLAEDGAIFISIDDNEVHRLREVLDEIFGGENFIATFIWEKRTTRENRRVFSFSHDFILCYAKRKSEFEERRGELPLTDVVRERYDNPDKDTRGEWQSVSLNAQAGHGTAAQFYSITLPSGRKIDPPPGRCWSVTEKRYKELVADNRIWFGKGGDNVPRVKKFLKEADRGLTPHTLWTAKEVGTTDSATKDLLSILQGEGSFETPKPTQLIQRIFEIATDKASLILDSFAGSGTTAHAVLALNKKDSGNRKFILVEMEDYADKLTAERVRRVIGGYKFEGTQREELLREPITLTALKKSAALLEKADSFDLLDKQRFDRIAKFGGGRRIGRHRREEGDGKGGGLGWQFHILHAGRGDGHWPFADGRQAARVRHAGEIRFLHRHRPDAGGRAETKGGRRRLHRRNGVVSRPSVLQGGEEMAREQ